MKEIDFLPEWYKSGRRRQISYRTQYIALGGVFVVMVVWNFIGIHSVSKAKSELAQSQSTISVAENISREFAEITNQMEELQKRANILGKIDSEIDVADVLAEISFLIDGKIVLSRVEFSAEKFANKQGPSASGRTANAVRLASGNFAGKETLSLGDVRFKVVISGVAADASDVAELICKLEESPYFCLVYPSFSRDKKINVGPVKSKSRSGTIAASVPRQSRAVPTSKRVGTTLTRENLQVTEFEIGCYLANYKIVDSR